MKGDILMKYTFYIEGQDNVGKSTTIDFYKDNTYPERIVGINRLSFFKYPTDSLKTIIRDSLAEIKVIDPSKDITLYIQKYGKLMHTIIDDMYYSMTNEDNDIVTICDRGPLSTFMYQFYEYIKEAVKGHGVDTTNPSDLGMLLNTFFTGFFYNRYGDKEFFTDKTYSIILYNNRPDIPLHTDKEETIEYKRQFDKDTYLQERINNIISIMYNNKITKSNSMRYFYICIYDDNGKRKSSDTLCEEINTIINKVITDNSKEENNE